MPAPDDGPIFMLNVIWFKPDRGREVYDDYLRAAGPFVATHGGRLDAAYRPEADVIGDLAADLVFLVEWPSRKAFQDFLADPGYRAVMHLREEAIRDSLLIRCTKM